MDWLSDSEQTFLVSDITPEEVAHAINSFPTGKAPGPAVLPIYFYKSHLKLLAPKLASLNKTCLLSGSLPSPMNEAHMILYTL